MDSGLIEEVVGTINCGKEAEVFLARGNNKQIAIKVFKQKQQRSFSNRSAYDLDMMNGHRREARALKNKSKFGMKEAEDFWRGREIHYLTLLYDAGADVPKVLGTGPNSFAMEFVLLGEAAAPRLIDIKSQLKDPQAILEKIIANMRIFLKCDLVHGDLSLFNILYRGGNDVVIIDVPQAVEIMRSPSARDLFRRDIKNICTFFNKLGVHCDEDNLFYDLWQEDYRSVVRR